VTIVPSPADFQGQYGRWRLPVDPARYDTTPMLSEAEKDAIIGLDAGGLRRLARHDPSAPEWAQVRRLARPLDDAAGSLDGPLTPHRRRAMLDAAAVVLLRCAETSRSYWSWAEGEWAGLLGQDQQGFRKAMPGWGDDAVRPYLAAHAFLLGGFTALLPARELQPPHPGLARFRPRARGRRDRPHPLRAGGVGLPARTRR
jgi:hypothetical protein